MRCPPPDHTRAPLAHNSTGPATRFCCSKKAKDRSCTHDVRRPRWRLFQCRFRCRLQLSQVLRSGSFRYWIRLRGGGETKNAFATVDANVGTSLHQTGRDWATLVLTAHNPEKTSSRGPGGCSATIRATRGAYAASVSQRSNLTPRRGSAKCPGHSRGWPQVGCGWQVARNRHGGCALWVHLLVGQEAVEKVWVCGERRTMWRSTKASGIADDAERLDTGEPAEEVVVGLVTVLLKVGPVPPAWFGCPFKPGSSCGVTARAANCPGIAVTAHSGSVAVSISRAEEAWLASLRHSRGSHADRLKLGGEVPTAFRIIVWLVEMVSDDGDQGLAERLL